MTIASFGGLSNLQSGQTAGVAQGAATGLAAEFGSIFSMFFSAAGDAENLLGQSLSTQQTSIMADAMTGQLGHQLPFLHSGLLVTGTPIAHEQLITLVQELEAVLIELEDAGVELGDIDTVDQLAKAYEQLGMTKDEAFTKAQRVDTAIKIVAENQPAIQSILSAAQQQLTDSALSDEQRVTVLRIQESVMAFSQAIEIEPQSTTLADRVKRGLPLVEEKVMPQKVVQVAQQVTVQNGDELVHEAVEQIVVNDEVVSTQKVQTTEVLEETLMTPQQKQDQEVTTRNYKEVVQANSERADTLTRDAVKPMAEPQTIYKLQPTNIGAPAFFQVTEMDVQTEGPTLMTDMVEGLDMDGATDMRAIDRAASSRTSTIVDRANVAQQVQNQIQMLANKNGGEVKMTLNPAELGEVEIKLDITDGRVSGKIITQTPEAMEQLARDLRILQQGLADAGLDLAQDGIEFQLSADQQGEQQFADADSEAEPEVIDDVEAEAEWRNVDQLVDVKV